MDMKWFSKINLERCNQWHNINDWTVDEWAISIVGELGEACNEIKKLRRFRMNIHQANNDNRTEEQIIEALGNEIADTFCYLDLMASRLNLDLETLVKKKFNQISDREGLPQKI